MNARTCKHLRSILGDKYEDARLKLKNPFSEVPVAKGKGKTTPTAKSVKTKATAKAKSVGRKRKGRDEDDGEEDQDAAGDEEEGQRPPKRTRIGRSGESSAVTRGRGRGGARPQNKRMKNEEEDEEDVVDEKPASQRARLVSGSTRGKAKVEDVVEVEEQDADVEGDTVDPDANVAVDSHEEDEIKQVGEDGVNAGEDGEDEKDELGEINGIKPKVYLKEGDETEVSSMTRFACLHFHIFYHCMSIMKGGR